MFAQIDGLLSPQQLERLRGLVTQTQFDDGSATSGRIAAGRKRNLQMRATGEPAQQAAVMVQQAVLSSDEFVRLTVPRRLHLAFNRYEPGMEYGAHFDAGVVGASMERALRTDISMTLFLNHPTDYDGGVLHIDTAFGEQEIKLPAGSAILYPGNLRHWVTPVTRGARLAAFGWVQSMVRNAEQRRIVSDLNLLRRRLAETEADEELQQLASCGYQDLLRQWADL
ncbi:MAG: Fe2+-dependent dioxygenase [Alphaproteobacteria bacterium]